MFYELLNSESFEDQAFTTANQDLLFLQELSLSEIGVKHTHKYVYFPSSPNRMQELGSNFGLILFFYYVVTLLMRPLARHSFIMRSLKRFYFIRQNEHDEELFLEPSKRTQMRMEFADIQRDY